MKQTLTLTMTALALTTSVAAQEVMVVTGDGAPPVHGLALAVPQDINQPVVRERLQDPVGSGQGYGGALVLQDPVELLGTDEVVKLIQGGAHRQSLLGDTLLPAAGGGRCG